MFSIYSYTGTYAKEKTEKGSTLQQCYERRNEGPNFFKKNIGNETATSEFGLMLDPMVRRKQRTGQSPLSVLNRG